MLIPRMTSTQRNGINTPATGLLVFDTSSKSFWFYNGSAWKDLTLNTQLTEAEVDNFTYDNGFLLNEVVGDITNELELPLSPTKGTMVYYNGSKWVAISPGSTGEKLCYCDGVPTWGTCPPPTATCSDGIKNQGETGIDCGGSCPKCPCSFSINYVNEGGGGLCTTGLASVSGVSNVNVNWTWALGGQSGTINGSTVQPIYYQVGDWTNFYISICATPASCSRKCKSFLLDCGRGDPGGPGNPGKTITHSEFNKE